MTPEAAARIQSHEAKAGSGGVEKGGFAARAQVRLLRLDLDLETSFSRLRIP